jgi:ferric-dicitrate binding protein FerR (iron transport regulator)
MEAATWWFMELIATSDVNLLWPEFEKWLRQDKSNQYAYETVERVWCRYGRPPVLTARCGVSCIGRVWLH